MKHNGHDTTTWKQHQKTASDMVEKREHATAYGYIGQGLAPLWRLADCATDGLTAHLQVPAPRPAFALSCAVRATVHRSVLCGQDMFECRHVYIFERVDALERRSGDLSLRQSRVGAHQRPHPRSAACNHTFSAFAHCMMILCVCARPHAVHVCTCCRAHTQRTPEMLACTLPRHMATR